jgi:hypothetical protein
MERYSPLQWTLGAVLRLTPRCDEDHKDRPRVVAQIVGSLRTDLDPSERERKASLVELQQRLAAICTRMNQIYEDKLDGKISQEFWDRKHAEYRDGERTVQVQIARASEPVT